jgi:hypothetical protein
MIHLEGFEVFSSITVAELDGDAEPELVFGVDTTSSNDQGAGLYALNLDGSNVTGNWPVILNVDVRSSPAVADLDKDGLDEVVVGTYGPPDTVLIFDHDGTRIGASQSAFSVFSSPAIGDLDGDGDLEIAIGTSDGTLLALERDGTPISEVWPISLPLSSEPFDRRNDVDSSPALGDLDGDGRPEIVVLTDDGVVHAYRVKGQSLPGFPFESSRMTYPKNLPTSANSASPLIADLDGDGRLDILAAMSNGRVYGLRHDGSMLEGFPIVLPPGRADSEPAAPGDEILSTPSLGDLDGDGLLELAVVHYSGESDESRLYVFDLAGPANSMNGKWATFKRHSLRTSFLPGPPNGDCNGDGAVDREDLWCLLTSWYLRHTMPGFRSTIDFDNSDRADTLDLLRFIETLDSDAN